MPKYEAHITIEPVFDEKLEQFTAFCQPFGFKPANLLLQKSRAVTAERSDKDTFCTGHGDELFDIESRMTGLLAVLQQHGFLVWRYKIEEILIDVRLGLASQ